MGKTDTIQAPIFADDAPGYEADFYAWLMEQSARLRLLRVPGLDSENLAEEIESLARHDRNEIANRMGMLLAHLLKWRHQPDRQGVSWQLTIREQRRRIRVLLENSPSLRRTVPDVLANEHGHAREQAALETDMPEAAFPSACEWTPDQVLEASFLPEAGLAN